MSKKEFPSSSPRGFAEASIAAVLQAGFSLVDVADVIYEMRAICVERMREAEERAHAAVEEANQMEKEFHGRLQRSVEAPQPMSRMYS
ncbi:MAG: hypothetical protein ACWA44_02350 [Thiotrichales bacterium]